MTVRVTTLKGALAGSYYVEALQSYYLDAGEPAGVWFGAGAALLGLSGEVDDAAFLAVMAGLDPDEPDRHLGRVFDEKSVRGFDVTCSAPKSVSLLWGLGDPDTRTSVLSAHDAAVEAVTGWIERHAHTRFRINGEVAVVDAEGIVAARFRQHTSRALDPQSQPTTDTTNSTPPTSSTSGPSRTATNGSSKNSTDHPTSTTDPTSASNARPTRATSEAVTCPLGRRDPQRLVSGAAATSQRSVSIVGSGCRGVATPATGVAVGLLRVDQEPTRMHDA